MFLYIYLSNKLLLQVAIQPCHPSSRSHPKNPWPQNRSPHHVREIMNHKIPYSIPTSLYPAFIPEGRNFVLKYEYQLHGLFAMFISFPRGSASRLIIPHLQRSFSLVLLLVNLKFFLGRRKDTRRRWNHSHHTLRFRKWEGEWWGTLGIGKSKFFERKFRQGYFISQWRFGFLFFVFLIFFNFFPFGLVLAKRVNFFPMY